MTLKEVRGVDGKHMDGGDVFHRQPDFVGHVQNVTVAVGREADLQCQVKNVGEYKVRHASWYVLQHASKYAG